MTKQRRSPPKSIRDGVLGEFNHKCAVCGKERPHIHHIDEDPGNNDPLNLIPLCPNCHLVDQHNPTQPIDPGKLSLFRLHKDPAILKPQFHPLFLRLLFLDSVSDDQPTTAIKENVEELVSFVKTLQMGQFYGEQILKLLKEPGRWYVSSLYGPDQEQIAKIRENQMEYRRQVRSARKAVQTLAIELLRYQKWN